MRPDRRGKGGLLLLVEEVVPTMDENLSRAGRSVADIARLFEIASRQDEALTRLDGCMTELREVQSARSALKGCTPAELQAALRYRRRLLDERAS